MGSHDELMAKKGVYHKLVVLQTIAVGGGVIEINEEDLTEEEKGVCSLKKLP